MEPAEILKHGTEKMGIEISQYQIEQFIKYKDLLLEWNQKMNLTAITEEKEIIIMHFLDSISCLQTKSLSIRPTAGPLQLIDVGTGAGFPGIPLKIMLPEIKLTLLDSLKGMIGFL